MRRKPGRRPTADQIIAYTTLWSIGIVGLAMAIAALIMVLSGRMHIIPSVILGGAVVCAMNIVSLFVSYLGDRVPSLTTVSAIGGYVVKLGLIVGTFVILKRVAFFVPSVVAISIICGIMLWLAVLSFAVVRTEGPAIGE